MLFEESAQFRTASRPTAALVVVDDAAAGEGLVNLRIEIVAIREDQKGEVRADPAMHLLREKDDRVRFADPLGVPEDAELAGAFLPVTHRLDRAVHPENLLILCDDLHELASTIVEQDEILENIEQPPLGAYPLQKGFHVDDARIALSSLFHSRKCLYLLESEPYLAAISLPSTMKALCSKRCGIVSL